MSTLHQIKTYIKWLPKTFYLHGIHSPFVFQLKKNCLKDTQPSTAYTTLSSYRKELYSNSKEITITDFGAGSRIFKSNTRKIQDIARHAGATLKRMQLLHRVIRYFQPENVLELGTSLGLSTIAMAIHKNTKVTTLEGCPETAKVAQEQLHKFEVTNIQCIVSPFEKSLDNVHTNMYDFIYFDGNHSKKATLTYAKKLLPTATNNSCWIFDDIHWSPEMTEAWSEIKKIPAVSVTIDCFWFGIVFFRKEQSKEHFYIRT